MYFEAYHAARIVIAAKKALAESSKLFYESAAGEETIFFNFMPRMSSGRPQDMEAFSPSKWFKLCREEGLCDVYLLTRMEYRDNEKPLIPNPCETYMACIVTVYQNGRVQYWIPSCDYYEDFEEWNISYTEYPWPDAPRERPAFPDNLNAFRSVLNEIELFADKIGEDDFSELFREARQTLDGEVPCDCQDSILSILPMQNYRRFMAASTASVFGGMGSWDDMPHTTAEAMGLEDKYSSLSAELKKQIRLAEVYAVNQWGC